MSPSRFLFVAAVVLCENIGCQAKPLSFNGVQLGQKWGPFLKAHPKAEVFSLGFDEVPLSRAQKLAQEEKRKETVLVELWKIDPQGGSTYFFRNQVLVQAVFSTAVDERKKTSRGLLELKPSLKKILDELGPPDEQGVTKPIGYGQWHRSLLVWRTNHQCAFATLSWPRGKEKLPTVIGLNVVNAPWRSANLGFRLIWPAVISPNEEDESRRRELMALMEQLRPGSTDAIKSLKVAPLVDLSGLKASTSRN